MDYKKIIKSQNVRLKILSLLGFIPDKLMLKIQFRIKTGRKLNLKNPKRFNEKLQWYKLHYRDPLMTKCTDKYRVREYVKEKGLEEILVPLYGVYENAHEINFNILPEKFVIKTNNGSGSNTNIICTDKDTLDINDTFKKMNDWTFERNVKAGREWSYYNIEPKIISEKFLEDTTEHGLIDYKFYCFSGKPHFVKLATDLAGDERPKNGFYDLEFNQLPYCRTDADKIVTKIEKPNNFEEMCDIASKLSKDFPHVRVDLYNISGKIYFGELTFYDTSGYQIFAPDEFDFILGELFKLDKIVHNDNLHR